MVIMLQSARSSFIITIQDENESNIREENGREMKRKH